jgi:hypothetical protein
MFRASFIQSRILKRKQNFAKFAVDDQRCYLFQLDSKYRRSNGEQVHYYRCISCYQKRREQLAGAGGDGSLGRVSLAGEPLSYESDPALVQHHPDCRPYENTAIEVQECFTQAKKQIRCGDKRPRQAYDDVVLSISSKHTDDVAAQNTMKLAMPSYESIELVKLRDTYRTRNCAIVLTNVYINILCAKFLAGKSFGFSGHVYRGLSIYSTVLSLWPCINKSKYIYMYMLVATTKNLRKHGRVLCNA